MSCAKSEDILAAKLFLQAAFPVMTVPLNEDPSFVKKFENINMVVQFLAEDDNEPLSCHIVFMTEEKANELNGGKRFKVYDGVYDNRFPSITCIKMHFKSIESFLGVLKGNTPLDTLGIVPSVVKNIYKPGLIPFVMLMLSLMKMMPNFLPDETKPFDQYMKVKMSLYMITTAMSRANKLGYKPMEEWCKTQTDRVYQFKVGPTLDSQGKEIYEPIGAFMRIKFGKTKAGRGEYARKKPFVLLEFPNPNGCVAVLSGKYEMVDAVSMGFVSAVGAGDSYAIQFNDMMMDIQNMLIPSKYVK